MFASSVVSNTDYHTSRTVYVTIGWPFLFARSLAAALATLAFNGILLLDNGIEKKKKSSLFFFFVCCLSNESNRDADGRDQVKNAYHLPCNGVIMFTRATMNNDRHLRVLMF